MDQRPLTSVAQLVAVLSQKVSGSILVRAHTETEGSIPRWESARSSRWMFLSHIDVSLPLHPSLPIAPKSLGMSLSKDF